MPFALVSITPLATPWTSDKTNGLALACSRYRRGWRIWSAISSICAASPSLHQRNAGRAKIRSVAWTYLGFLTSVHCACAITRSHGPAQWRIAMAASRAEFFKRNGCRCPPRVGLQNRLRNIFSNDIASGAEWSRLVRRARNLDCLIVLRIPGNDASLCA